MRTHYLKDSIFRALARFPHGLTTDELIEQVYNGSEPDFAKDSVWVTLYMMRKMALPFAIKRVRYRWQLFFT